MLVGRERERHVIQALVAAARVGESGALVLVGEAGIGKTALLDYAAEAATGLQVLRARGTASEAEVPFGSLLQLLRPALVHLERIPRPQAEALESALALRPGTGGDRFAIGAATLSLLCRLAEDQPVALLVDDAHLLDLPSAQALTFAARRLTADPVVLLAAVREGDPSALTDAGLPVLELGGLSDEEAGELVGAVGRRLGRQGVSRLRAATGGNPLALIELSDDAVQALPPDAPVPVPASLARTFARRADQLSADARTALLVAAASRGELAVVARACEVLGVQVAALDEAEAAELVRVDAGEITFRHDLVRSGVYAEAAPTLRRAVHRALADALSPDDVDHRAWHAGEAATGPDEDTAALLAVAAERARDRSAHAVAAAGFERAARLTPEPAASVSRLVDAAHCSWQAGLADHAVALLDRAAELPQTVTLRARADGLRGRVAARTGSGQEARDMLVGAAALVADDDADAAIGLLAEAIQVCLFLADTDTVTSVAAQVDALVPRASTEQARWMGEMAAGVAGVMTGQGGPERIRAAMQLVVPDGALLHDPVLASWLVVGPLFLRESGTGRQVIRTVMADMRRRTAIGGMPYLLFHLARDQATTDRWDVAQATYSEGIQLAREAGQWSDLAGGLAGVAWLESRRGREADCRAHAAESLQVSRSRQLALFEAWSMLALGELELGAGRAEQALDHLEAVDRLLTGLGMDDVDLAPGPELVDALVRLGREDEARAVADRHLAAAAVKGQPWSLARAARCAVMTCPDDELDALAATALEHHSRTLDSFERARTQLAYGARLRRARRRVDAREPLRDSLTAFETLGATPWADQAAVELRATGETAQRRGSTEVAELTPQELQVARMLAGGRTTREAAAALFLSPKTIEYHLRHVYIKLDVRSRSELADRIDPQA